MLTKVTNLIGIVGSKAKVAKAIQVHYVTLDRWYRDRRLPYPATRARIDNLHRELCGLGEGDIRRGRRAWRRYRPNRVEGFIDGDGI